MTLKEKRDGKIKHSCTCNDCKKEFFLEDAAWCKHKIKLNIGSKTCPSCGMNLRTSPRNTLDRQRLLLVKEKY